MTYTVSSGTLNLVYHTIAAAADVRLLTTLRLVVLICYFIINIFTKTQLCGSESWTLTLAHLQWSHVIIRVDQSLVVDQDDRLE